MKQFRKPFDSMTRAVIVPDTNMHQVAGNIEMECTNFSVQESQKHKDTQQSDNKAWCNVRFQSQ